MKKDEFIQKWFPWMYYKTLDDAYPDKQKMEKELDELLTAKGGQVQPPVSLQKGDLVKTHSASDYGYYGKNGFFENPELPINNCRCGKKGVLRADYDDTPGFRETVYQLECKNCNIKTNYTCIIENIITEWNKKTQALLSK